MLSAEDELLNVLQTANTIESLTYVSPATRFIGIVAVCSDVATLRVRAPCQ